MIIRKRTRLLLTLPLLFVFAVGVFISSFSSVSGISDDEFNQKNQEVLELEAKVAEYASAAKTLFNQIGLMNSQIQLTSLKIQQTQNSIAILEEQIAELSGKIDKLDVSLNRLSVIFLDRVVETYKQGKTDSFYLLLSSNSFADFARQLKYLRVLQTNDRRIMLSLEEARLNYDNQKQEKEIKQKELETLKVQLDQQNANLIVQKSDKEHLLAVTKNDEKKYQALLSQARAELEAIQSIIAGEGQETGAGTVSQGEKIASVISGTSACSTGTHLHFEVRKAGQVQNPFSYLTNISLINSSGGDSYSLSGSWSWPIHEPIRLTQGHGSDTWWVRSGIAPYSFHTGIDIVSDNLEVISVGEGELYNGSVKCGGGQLRYVRVEHKDSDISTYYLHINYAKI